MFHRLPQEWKPTKYSGEKQGHSVRKTGLGASGGLRLRRLSRELDQVQGTESLPLGSMAASLGLPWTGKGTLKH